MRSSGLGIIDRHMKTNLKPSYEIELREYEAAHKVWMSTSIFQPKEVRESVRLALDRASANYKLAYEAANPTHKVI